MWPLLRNLLVAVFVLTGLALAFRDLSGGAISSARNEQVRLEPGEDEDSVVLGDDEIEIAPSAHGHFRLNAEVNGETVDFMVDTGASLVVFGPETAARLGFDPDYLEFSGRTQTANGIASVAWITLDEIVIGDLTVGPVKAAVVQAPMETSLLGMSFLAQLDGYEVRDGRLVFRW